MRSPELSIVTATYNRASALDRCVRSVLTQDFDDWELVVVDDGSTDATVDVLSGFVDPRIHVIRHEVNRGVCAAKNTGIEAVHGDWFAFLDSDDELLPGAMNKVLDIAHLYPDLDAVNSNTINSATGAFNSTGLEASGPVDYGTMIARCRGDQWGIHRRGLVGNLRFNEKVPGFEATFFFRLSDTGKRYYLHEGLVLVHTEGHDRLSGAGSARDLDDVLYFAEFEHEAEYLRLLRMYRPTEFADLSFMMALVAARQGRRRDGWRHLSGCLRTGSVARSAFVALCLLGGPRATGHMYRSAKKSLGMTSS